MAAAAKWRADGMILSASHVIEVVMTKTTPFEDDELLTWCFTDWLAEDPRRLAAWDTGQCEPLEKQFLRAASAGDAKG